MKQTARKILSILTSVLLIICIAGIPLLTSAFTPESLAAYESLTEEQTSENEKTESPFVPDKENPSVFIQDGTFYKLYPIEINIDVNGDNECTASDARKILRFSAELEEYDGDYSYIDISRDGEVTATDARLLLRYTADLDHYFADDEGKTISGFAKTTDNQTCYFEDSGVLAIGLKTIDGVLYHFNSKGYMSTGLVKTGGCVYYFDSNGLPFSGKTTVNNENYWFENGKAKTGVIKEGNLSFYYNSNGVLTSGIVVIDGSTYYFNADGQVANGKKTVNGKIYFFENGKAKTGLWQNGKNYYYANSDGTMATGVVKLSDGLYSFNSNAEPLNGKYNIDGSFYQFENGKAKTGLWQTDKNYFYAHSDGKMATGLVKLSNGLYYFNQNANPVSGKTTIDGKIYFFENGKAKTGLIKDGNYYYYVKSDYSLATGIVEVNGQKYKFDKNGRGSVYKPVASDFKTAMIGDSLVASIGLANVTDLIDFYGKVSLTTTTIYNKKISGSSRYVIDEIKGRGYDKIIILLGINELYQNTDTWIAQYKKVVDAVKSRAPGADIYAHAILPVHEQRAKANGYTVRNSSINTKNAALKKLAAQEGIYYMDPRPAIASSDGTLPYEAASDGIHLGVTYSKKWSAYILQDICK